MKNKNQTNHKPFTKSFWALLASSIGCLALLYGGIVYGNTVIKIFSDALECQGEREQWCIKIGAKEAVDELDEKVDVRTTVPLEEEITADREEAPRLQITNNSEKEYFVPLKSKKERAAFLKARGRLGIDVCVVGENEESDIAGVGIEGCGDGEDGEACEIEVITGQQCRVKDKVVSWSIINQKKWHTGTNFDWSSTGLKSNASDPANQYWKSASNSNRTRCGGSGHYVGSYAYGPRHNGDKWAKYKCGKSSAWTCFWEGCNYWWTMVSSSATNKITTIREYTSEIIKETDNKRNYGSKCTEGYYTFRGTYTSTCYYSGDGTEGLSFNKKTPLQLFGQATAAEIIEDADEGYYDCQLSCSDYNRWNKQGDIPYAPAGCTSKGYTNTRIGACNNSCYNKDTCTSDFNCQLYDDGSTSKEYSDSCVFEWETGEWEANTWEECRLNEGYGTKSGSVTKSRTVICVDQDGDRSLDTSLCNKPVDDSIACLKDPNDCADTRERPDSTAYCDASDTKYYWKEGSVFGTCNASCDSGHLLAPTVGCETLGSSITKVYGSQTASPVCRKVVGNSDTKTIDKNCTDAGIPKPPITNKECSITCCDSNILK